MPIGRGIAGECPGMAFVLVEEVVTRDRVVLIAVRRLHARRRASGEDVRLGEGLRTSVRRAKKRQYQRAGCDGDADCLGLFEFHDATVGIDT